MRRTHSARPWAGLGLLAILASCGGGGGGAAPASATVPKAPPAGHVYVGTASGYGGSSMSFLPANITVSAGSTVTWDFLDGPHNVTSGAPGAPDGAFNSGTAQSSGSFVHTFPTAGTYPYYCSVHGAMMTGTVTVN